MSSTSISLQFALAAYWVLPPLVVVGGLLRQAQKSWKPEANDPVRRTLRPRKLSINIFIILLSFFLVAWIPIVRVPSLDILVQLMFIVVEFFSEGGNIVQYWFAMVVELLFLYVLSAGVAMGLETVLTSRE